MYTRPARTANIVLRIAVIVTTTSGLSSDMVNRKWIYSFEDDEVVMETTLNISFRFMCGSMLDVLVLGLALLLKQDIHLPS